MIFPQKKNNQYVEVKNSTILGNNQNSTNIDSFAFNDRTKKMNGYFNPNINESMTPKDFLSKQQSQEKALIL